MARGIFALGVMLAAMLALACGSATPAATPAPTVTPVPSPTPTATLPPTPTATLPGPAVTVTGPLVVFSERLEEGELVGEDRWVETRRVYVYDVGADNYWAAFDYRHAREPAGISSGYHFSAVRPAGTKLIVWSDGQVRRVGLNGSTEAILFEHDWIRTIKVAPDGTKVALTYGVPRDGEVLPRGLCVLDTATGAELLHIRYGDALLQPLRDAAHAESFALGAWHADSGSLSLIGRKLACGWCDPPAPAAIISLDGGMRMLPEGWVLSPDLRYALRRGEIAGYMAGKHAQPAVREGFDVMDSEEYLARFHPPSRATTDCPPNPAHSCRILLDGEVVGEGRWPSIVGFVELDRPPPAP